MKYVKNIIAAGALMTAGVVPFIFGMNDVTLTVGCFGLALPLLIYKGDAF